MKPSPAPSPPAPSPPRRASRWLAHPVLSVLLFVVWLLLRQSALPVDVLFAAIFGLVVPRLLHPLLGPPSRVLSIPTAVRLTLVVLWDIVLSNITVAKIVLSPAARPRPAWLRVPLLTRQPMAITLLASIITMTPGTVSCVVDRDGDHLLVHALDCDDPAEVVRQIQERYQRPLLEIFG